MPEFHGLPSGVGRRIVVVASRFNEPIVKKLVDGALEALVKYGVAFDDIDVVWVPGAWELPIAARWVLARERSRRSTRGRCEAARIPIASRHRSGTTSPSHPRSDGSPACWCARCRTPGASWTRVSPTSPPIGGSSGLAR